MSEDHSKRNRIEGTSLVKVRFALSADDRAHGVEAERLWAEDIGGREFRLDNVPFYVYGVSLGDVIAADVVDDGQLQFRAVVRHGGHSTYRVLVKHAEGYESHAFKDLWRQLETMGCSYEVARRRWVAIDVPPEVDIFAVYRVLEAGEGRGAWAFEEGHCGHPIRG